MSASVPDVDGEEGDGCGALSGIDSSANALTTGTSAGFDTGRAVTTFLSLRVFTMISLSSSKSISQFDDLYPCSRKAQQDRAQVG